MNILLLTQYFWPEIGAPQVIHSEWIRRLTKRGHRVQVVTGFPNYPDGVIQPAYRRRVFMREQHEGAEVYRTATYAARNAGFARRLVNHLSLTASSWSAFPFVGPIDVVITEYPPLFTALSGIAFSRLRGVPHVLNAGDLWVEVALELGILKQGPLASAALAASTAVEKASARVLVTSKGCIQKLASVGIDPAKVVYLPNSVDTDAFQANAERRRRVRAEWGWEDAVVCLYHGTHGLAQGLLQVVETAHVLRDDPKLRFVLIGSGAEKDLVVQRVSELKLENVELHPPQPFSTMPGIIDACDIGLVPLKAIPMFGMTLPSKMFEFMSMEKAVALAVDGDAREIVEAGGAGLFAPPETPAAYAEVIRKLADDGALRKSMGRRGRALAVERYSRDRYATDLEQSLFDVVRCS
jgi:glycosyltransferase involved in cell wall biosynthesis